MTEPHLSRPRAALRRVFTPTAPEERRRLGDLLRTETVGGALLLGAAAVALVWANSPWHEAYRTVLDTRVGPHAVHLDLALGAWAADGLLALFFLVAGLELKRELLVGDLRDPAKALLPVVAAACGVIMPAVIYLALTAGDPAARHGWAIPVATDIAFALAVLAVLGSHLPTALRSFLLTLAVVDDLIAITIIAIFYTSDLAPLWLLAAAGSLALFALAARTGHAHWWLLIPLGALTWGFVHASGIHATVAGVLLAFTVPVRPRDGAPAGCSEADRMEHRLRPLSAGVVVPVFAFAAAGVRVVGDGAGEVWTDRVTLAIVVALVVGKAIGVFGGTWLTTHLTRANLDEGLSWADVAGAALLAGIGFTVSLLVGDLAFDSAEREAAVKVGVLGGSTVAAMLAAVVLLRRNKAYRRLDAEGAPSDGIGDDA